MGQKTNSTIFRLNLKNSEWKYKYIEKNKEESSIYLYKNIEIKNYLDKIFKYYGLLIHNYKIEVNNNKINIFISFYEKLLETNKFYKKNTTILNNKKLINFLLTQYIMTNLSSYHKNKILNIKIQNLNKKFEHNINKSQTNITEYKKLIKKTKKFIKMPIYKEFIKILFICIFEKNSSKLLTECISNYFTKNKKRHNYLIFFLKKILTLFLKSKLSKIQGIKILINGRFNGAPRAKQKLLQLGIVPLQSIKSNISYFNNTSYTYNGTFGIKIWICEKI